MFSEILGVIVLKLKLLKCDFIFKLNFITNQKKLNIINIMSYIN